MAKIGMGELILILIIAVVVLGPEKLPQAARALGKTIRSVKKYVHETTKDLEGVQELKDLQKDVTGLQRDLISMGEGLEKTIQADIDKAAMEMEEAEKKITAAVENRPEEKPAQNETKVQPEMETETAAHTSQEEINHD